MCDFTCPFMPSNEDMDMCGVDGTATGGLLALFAALFFLGKLLLRRKHDTWLYHCDVGERMTRTLSTAREEQRRYKRTRRSLSSCSLTLGSCALHADAARVYVCHQHVLLLSERPRPLAPNSSSNSFLFFSCTRTASCQGLSWAQMDVLPRHI